MYMKGCVCVCLKYYSFTRGTGELKKQKKAWSGMVQSHNSSLYNIVTRSKHLQRRLESSFFKAVRNPGLTQLVRAQETVAVCDCV